MADETSHAAGETTGRKYVGIIVIAVTAILIVISFGGSSVLAGRHRLTLTVHFQNVQGLRQGAPVRLAGVDVGTVKSVAARPELGEKPGEVVMLLRTDYDLRIPSDAVALLATEGLLGGTYVDIDTRVATAPPLKDGGELPTRETPHMSTTEAIEKFGEALKQAKPGQQTAAENNKTVRK